MAFIRTRLCGANRNRLLTQLLPLSRGRKHRKTGLHFGTSFFLFIISPFFLPTQEMPRGYLLKHVTDILKKTAGKWRDKNVICIRDDHNFCVTVLNYAICPIWQDFLNFPGIDSDANFKSLYAWFDLSRVCTFIGMSFPFEPRAILKAIF